MVCLSILVSSHYISECRCTHNSSIVSCGGRGSSKPSPIISQVKVLSSMPIPIFISPVNVRSSIGGGCTGESPLKPHGSALTPPTMFIGPLATPKSAAGMVRGVTPLALPDGKLPGVTSFGGGTGSWDFSNVSTCSAKRIYCQLNFQNHIIGKG